MSVRLCRFSTGWVRAAYGYWRLSAVQEEYGSDERWNVHIYCALRTPPYYGGHDWGYLLHVGGKPYSAPLTSCIYRAERWYWEMALNGRLCHGPHNPRPEFELANDIPNRDDPLARSSGIGYAGVNSYPDLPDLTEYHSTLPVICRGQQRKAEVIRDSGTQEWGVWISGDEAGWLGAGGSPYRAPANVCAQRAERWYWQTACGIEMPHSDDYPQSRWERENQIPDLDDESRLFQPA